MVDILISTLILFVLLGIYLYLRRRKRLVLELNGSVGDMFQQIEDNIHPPSKQELKCREDIGEKRDSLRSFLIQSQFSAVRRGFEEEMESAGFTLDMFNKIDWIAELYIDINKDSFRKIHEGIKYSKATRDYKEANLDFAKAKLNEWFGDKMLSGSFQEVEGFSKYRITYFIHDLEGKAKEILGENFFIKLAELSKECVGSEENRIKTEVASEKKRKK